MSFTSRMTSTRDGIARLLQRYELQDGIERHRLVAAWADVVGTPIGNYTALLGIQGTQLRVLVSDHRYMHHLAVLEPHILQAIEQQGYGRFSKLRLEYSNRPLPKPRRRANQPAFTPSQRPLSDAEQAWIRELTQQADEDSREQLERALSAYLRRQDSHGG